MNNSAKTSVNQIPALHKKINWLPGQINLDIGGGKYETATMFLKDNGVYNFVYDLYNRTPEHNSSVLQFKGYDSATIANVLNVIKYDHERIAVLMIAKEHVRANKIVYISVYEGNKSGISSISAIGTHQENKKLKRYLPIIYEVWDPQFVVLKKNMIEVANGRLSNLN